MKLRTKQVVASASLSTLFLLVYGTCNWITSLRTGVGSCFFEWECRVPFIPALILPYMSIDLFFIAAPFLTRSDRELATLAKRIIAAILIAGVCFLLYPLRFAFERPHVEGFLGIIFNSFRTMDLPFNEVPSLHIALLAILADVYHRHLKGILYGLTAAWFVLIFVSPVFTYQHHLIDIIGGGVLAILCLHFIDERPLRVTFVPNRRVGLYYGLGSWGLIGLSILWRPWSLMLLWPAFALAMIAAAYVWIGPGIHRKANGRIHWTSWLLFWPILAGQHLSRWHYARQCNAFDHLTGHIWIGRQLTRGETQQLQTNGIAAVIDLTSEFTEPLISENIQYLSIATLDLTPPTQQQIDEALQFIKVHTANGAVYIHCKVGYSRTAVIAGAYLMSAGHAANVEEAIAALQHARPSIIIRPEAVAALKEYQKTFNNEALYQAGHLAD